MKFKDYINEKKKPWNYVFRDVTKTLTVDANSEKAAINKIKKKWGISELPPNFYIWYDDKDKPSKGFEGYGKTTYGSKKNIIKTVI